jgi:hypothetical protein
MDSHAHTRKIYMAILEQLEELYLLHADAADPEEDEADEEDTSKNVDLVDGFVEEAVDRGIPEEAAEQVFKAIAALEKKAKEG